ncbi:MAG: menaquinone biosynthesis protein [Acidobacteriota bacterium]
MKVKVGVVNFLNTKPLIYGLEKDHDRFRLVYDTPAQCASKLETREVDIAILPAIEYASSEKYSIISDISITSKGSAGSVLLFSKKEIGEIRTIALDRNSRTSIALLKILCREKFRIDPGFHPMPPDLGTMLSENDAALVIGDNALFAPEYFQEMLAADLGREWFEMTSLPFVFAFWCGFPDIKPSLIKAFLESRDLGIQKLDEISKRYSFLGRTFLYLSRRYLTENMTYSFGDEEKKGLVLFYELCLKHDLITEIPTLRFFSV